MNMNNFKLEVYGVTNQGKRPQSEIGVSGYCHNQV